MWAHQAMPPAIPATVADVVEVDEKGNVAVGPKLDVRHTANYR